MHSFGTGLEHHYQGAMFGLVAICWATWKIHNRICFEKVLLRNIFEATFSAVFFMRYFTGMQSEYSEDDLDGCKSGGEHGYEVDARKE
jgi:hypothetical protein